MILITHDDRFHADDVFALAALRILLGDKIEKVIRTRDESIIVGGDIVFDVGYIYDADKNRFDHHQAEGAGVRENGIPYAAFGLVWKKWGTEICGSEYASDLIEKKIVQPIDAGDNGYALCEYFIPEVKEYAMDFVCKSFGSTWKEEDNHDEVYFEVVDMVEKILRREIKVAQDKYEAVPLVEKAYQDSEDKRLIVVDEYYPWGDVLEKYSDILFVISPDKKKNQWRINTMQDDLFVNRKDLPKEWSGLRGAELEKVSGVKGALFCHRKLFLAGADNKESAILLAKKAIES